MFVSWFVVFGLSSYWFSLFHCFLCICLFDVVVCLFCFFSCLFGHLYHCLCLSSVSMDGHVGAFVGIEVRVW